MINDSFDPENKIQSKGDVSTKPDILPWNDHDTTVAQNSEPVQLKRNNHKEKELMTSEEKKKQKHIHFQVVHLPKNDYYSQFDFSVDMNVANARYFLK